MNVLSSLTNRIFVASALLVLITIGIAIYRVTIAVTARAQADLLSDLDEAASLVDQYSRRQFGDFMVKSSLIANLPKLGGAAATDHPPTVQPIAEEYCRLAAADLFAVVGLTGRLLANAGRIKPSETELAAIVAAPARHDDGSSFHVVPGGLVHTVALPIGDGSVGTLVVGYSFDREFVAQIKKVTNSDIALVAGARVVASTLDAARTAPLASIDASAGTFTRSLGNEEFIGRAQSLGGGGPDEPQALVLRSRTEHLRFLRALHWQVALTGLAAVGVATLVAYGIARTVTRPMRALTATMGEIASTGDLAQSVPSAGRWDDEDAKLLSATFGRLTSALDRFRREAAQRERLSSLGRLSAVVAHEIRNPLMIIKLAAGGLRHARERDVVDTAASIDEEIRRLDRVVSGVLDLARPIRFELGRADLAVICRDAADAASAGADDVRVELHVPVDPVPVVTDGERVRAAIVNLLSNAQQAVRAGGSRASAVRLSLRSLAGGRSRIEIADTGVGIAPEDLTRIFEPFFTTRRTGSGLGLPIARNVIEGLGGTIVVESRPAEGTTVVIELPDHPPAAERSA